MINKKGIDMLTFILGFFGLWFLGACFVAAFDGSGNTLAKVVSGIAVLAIPAYVLMA